MGSDYGLDAIESTLLFNKPTGSALFSQIATVYPGSPYTLTLLSSFSCGGSATPYALSFAEQSLNQLTTALKALVVNATSRTPTTIDATAGAAGTAFLVERQTGLMVAASVDGQVAGAPGSDGKATRVAAVAAPDTTISGAAALLGSFASLAPGVTVTAESSGLWVAAAVYQVANLDWVLVAVIPKTNELLAVATASAVAIGGSLALIAVGTAAIVTFVYCCVSLPMARLRQYYGEADRAKLVGVAESDDGELPVHAASPPVGDEPVSNVREINDIAASLASYSSRLRAANASAMEGAKATAPALAKA